MIVRRKKEETLGPATMPKHEAQQKLAEYIEEYTGKLIRQGQSIESFAELWWKAFSAVKAGSWGKKTREDVLLIVATSTGRPFLSGLLADPSWPAASPFRRPRTTWPTV